MHDTQRGEKNTDAKNMPVMKECRHYRKIDDGLRQKEGQICPLHRHMPYRSTSRGLIGATPCSLETIGRSKQRNLNIRGKNASSFSWEKRRAVLVYDELCLADRELHRIVHAGEDVGAHEFMYQHFIAGLFFDAARQAELAALLDRRRIDQILAMRMRLRLGDLLRRVGGRLAGAEGREDFGKTMPWLSLLNLCHV